MGGRLLLCFSVILAIAIVHGSSPYKKGRRRFVSNCQPKKNVPCPKDCAPRYYKSKATACWKCTCKKSSANTFIKPGRRTRCPLAGGCRKYCRHGFKKDRYGCQTCQCANPCARWRCPNGSVCRVTRPNCSYPPCERKAKCVKKYASVLPVSQCPWITRAPRCKFGLQQDRRGCSIPRCHNPCEGHWCGLGRTCAMKPSRCIRAPCPLRPTCVRKHGRVCPHVSIFQSPWPPCGNHCSRRRRCSRGRICCSNGCGTRCYRGIKPGHCTPNHSQRHRPKCKLRCRNGWQNGPRGCPLCECFRPCQDIACPSGGKCRTIPGWCHHALCPVMTTCPRPSLAPGANPVGIGPRTCECSVIGDPMAELFDKQSMSLLYPSKTYLVSKLEPNNGQISCGYGVWVRLGSADATTGVIVPDEVTVTAKDSATDAIFSFTSNGVANRGVGIQTPKVIGGVAVEPYAGGYVVRFLQCNGVSIKVKIDGANSKIFVKIPTEAGNQATGLCGNCDGIQNDYRLRDGTDVSRLDSKFGLIGQSYEETAPTSNNPQPSRRR